MKTAREEFLDRYASGERNFAGIRLLQHGKGVDLSGVVLQDINLCGADLSEICLDGANLTGAEMRGVILRDARLCNAVLRNVDLMGACLNGAACSQAIFDNVDLTYINALNGVFIETRINAVLEHAILSYANFKGARLVDRDELMGRLVFRHPSYFNYIYGMTMPDGTYVEDWDWDVWG